MGNVVSRSYRNKRGYKPGCEKCVCCLVQAVSLDFRAEAACEQICREKAQSHGHQTCRSGEIAVHIHKVGDGFPESLLKQRPCGPTMQAIEEDGG